MRHRSLIAALFVAPATAYANIGLPIAPLVGIQIVYYLPGLILIECLVVKWGLRLSWSQSFTCSIKWNAITTLLGFPLLLLLLLAILWASGAAGIDMEQVFGPAVHLYWSFPPVMHATEQPESWYSFLTYAMLLWGFVAFALSVEVEERLARRSIEISLARRDRKRIHWTVLAANTASYIPFWLFTIVHDWTRG